MKSTWAKRIVTTVVIVLILVVAAGAFFTLDRFVIVEGTFISGTSRRWICGSGRLPAPHTIS